MKLSTKGRYGLKAMFELANYYGKGPLSLKHIAEKQQISANYLEQLFSSLKKEKLVKSIRGAQGGYMLNKPPKDTTVGEIIRALEGDISLASCISENKKQDCPNEETCPAKGVWKKLNDRINETIDSTTLEDMIEDSI